MCSIIVIKNRKKIGSNIVVSLLISMLILGCKTKKFSDFNKDYSLRIKNERTKDKVLEAKIDSVPALMNLEKKARQMLHISLVNTPCENQPYPAVFDTTKLLSFMGKYDMGFAFNDLGLSEACCYDFMTRIRGAYMRNSRLKIPFINAVCHQHGAAMFEDAIIFPHDLMLAATFNTVHAYNRGWTTVLETAHLGHNFVYVPVVNLSRIPQCPDSMKHLANHLFCVARWENTGLTPTKNPAFELSYWRFGLRTAIAWRKRLKMPDAPNWNTVLQKIAPLPWQMINM